MRSNHPHADRPSPSPHQRQPRQPENRQRTRFGNDPEVVYDKRFLFVIDGREATCGSGGDSEGDLLGGTGGQRPTCDCAVVKDEGRLIGGDPMVIGVGSGAFFRNKISGSPAKVIPIGVFPADKKANRVVLVAGKAGREHDDIKRDFRVSGQRAEYAATVRAAAEQIGIVPGIDRTQEHDRARALGNSAVASGCGPHDPLTRPPLIRPVPPVQQRRLRRGAESEQTRRADHGAPCQS